MGSNREKSNIGNIMFFILNQKLFRILETPIIFSSTGINRLLVYELIINVYILKEFNLI